MLRQNTLVAMILAVSTSVLGCSGNPEYVNDFPSNEGPSLDLPINADFHNTEEVKFAEWFVDNNVVYYGSPEWCPPCKKFEEDMASDAFKILEDNGGYIECSKSPAGPIAQECIDAKVEYLPSFKVPGYENLITGYDHLSSLAFLIGYPGWQEL